MQQFFQNLQSKLWIFLSLKFDQATKYSNEIWLSIQPHLENVWDLAEEIFVYLLKYTTLSITFLKKIFASTIVYLILIKPYFKNLYDQNKYKAVGLFIFIVIIMIFWLLMLRHAQKNETDWKKTWILIILLFGPIGSLAYFFLRKRRLEKQQDRKDKVMMKFFSPMHKN